MMTTSDSHTHINHTTNNQSKNNNMHNSQPNSHSHKHDSRSVDVSGIPRSDVGSVPRNDVRIYLEPQEEQIVQRTSQNDEHQEIESHRPMQNEEITTPRNDARIDLEPKEEQSVQRTSQNDEHQEIESHRPIQNEDITSPKNESESAHKKGKESTSSKNSDEVSKLKAFYESRRNGSQEYIASESNVLIQSRPQTGGIKSPNASIPDESQNGKRLIVTPLRIKNNSRVCLSP